MDMQTKKVSYELNEVCVERFVAAAAHRRMLRLETQDWSVFSKYSMEYCNKACGIYLDRCEKLVRHIEYVTKKKVLDIKDDLSVSFEDGTRLHIVL